ncbi:SIR2 family protein [Nonomuraea sp. NPDC002799]
MSQPPSMVLTGDDHDAFIANLTADPAIIPPVIRRALTTRSLLFIGYGLRDRTFKSLFKGLQRSLPGMVRKRQVSVQGKPPNDQMEGRGGPPTMRYFTDRFEEWRISIYWGTINDFTGELRRRLGRR